MLRHFIGRKSKQLKILNPPLLAPGTLEHLQSYHWPGNVHELENLIERSLIQSQLQGGKVNGRGGAAEILQILPNTLRAKMRKLGIPHEMKYKVRKGKS